jgi:hypothetical protein
VKSLPKFALLVGLLFAVSSRGVRADGWFTLPGKAKSTSTSKPAPVRLANSFTNGTKSFVQNTANMFRPAKGTSVKSKPKTKQKQAPNKNDEPGFWSRLFNSEPPPPPRTVEEWMRLEQIRP